MRWSPIGGWMIAAAVLGGCGSTGARTADAAPVVADASASLAAQDSGYTTWRTLEMPSEPWVQRAASPAALLARVRDVVAAQMEEPDARVLPTRMQSETADSAVGMLLHPGQADDSVRDTEFRLYMRRDGAAWTVVRVERRERCWRGVSDGGLCS